MGDTGFVDPGRAGTVRLHLFGPAGLWSAEGVELRSVLQQPKRLALLAYLCLAQRTGFLRRDTILGVFWPELDQAHARRALRQSLHFLRASLGPGAITNRGGEEVGVRPAAVWCDAVEFQALTDADRLEEALDLYRNDLLPGFFVADAPDFEHWLEDERDRLRHMATDAAWRLAERVGATDAGAATRWARRAVALAPDDEAAIQRLLRSLQRKGDRAGALRAFEAFRRRLESEYGIRPSAETLALVEAVRATPASADDGLSPAVPGTTSPGDAGRADSAAAALEGQEAGAPDVAAQGDADSRDVGVVAATATDAATIHEEVDTPAAYPVPSGRTHRPRRLRQILGPVAVVALAVAGVWRFMAAWPARSVDADADLVAISPFEVLDSRFDVWGEGLMSVLAANLDGAGPLRTVSPAVAIHRWDGGYDREAAVRLGRATRAALTITGRVMGAGADSVRVIALLVDARRGEPIGSIEVRDTDDRIDRLTDSLTIRLLRETGRTRPIGAVRFAAIGSRSLPALKAYLKGDQFYRRTRWDSALAYYRLAAELDTTFAPALRRIGNVLMWQGIAGGDVARELHERAGRFNRGLAPRDSLLVLADSLASALYGFDQDPDWWLHARRHTATLQEAVRRYPDDPEMWNALGEAGFHFLTLMGTTAIDILAAFDRAIALDSSFAPAYLHPVGLSTAAGDTARALRYARAYLRNAQEGVTERGIALFVRVAEHGALTAADSTEYASSGEPAALFEAWAPLFEWPDGGESGSRIARWLATRRWLSPMPFADPVFDTILLARTLAFRGRGREALEIAGAHDPALFAELAWLGVIPSDVARETFLGWLHAGDADAARGALPWWALQRDTTSIAEFAHARARSIADSAAVRDAGSRRRLRQQAAYDTAAARAWLTLARGDTAGALGLFLSVADSLCPGCWAHRVERAELLLKADRVAEARAMLSQELTAIVGGPRPMEIRWRLMRAQAAERTGDAASASAGFRNILLLWAGADPALRGYVDSARAGVRRSQTDDVDGGFARGPADP